MKKFLIITFLAIVSSSFAQTDTLALLNSFEEGEGMRLKWMPRSSEVFLLGLTEGYNLYKAEVKLVNGGEQLGDYVKLNSEPILPWSTEKLESEVGKDSSILVASIFIAGADELRNRETPATVAGGIERAESDEMLMLLGLFASISNNNVADALGMYFVDKTSKKDQKVVYKIELIGHEELSSYNLIIKGKNPGGIGVTGIRSELFPGTVRVSWYNNYNRDFPYFNIYRSEKENGKYEKLNGIPFIGQTGNANMDPQFTSYYDSIPEYGKTYYYKVAGINAFEQQGKFSDPIKIKTSYLLQSTADITDLRSPDNQNVSIKWAYGLKDAPYVEQFAVYRAPNGAGPYRKVNTSPISSKSRSFMDETPKGSSNYYIVTAYGTSGDSTNSLLKACLLQDSIPPARPTILSGVCDTNGVVTLVWELNKEPDLEGYRIFKTYRPDLDPMRVIPGDTLLTEINDSVDLKMMYNSIFYKVVAIDNHFNPSLPSEYFEIPLPDVNPPSNGYFTDYAVGMKGIQLNWINSAAFDISKMYILRKSDEDFAFKPILVLSGDSLKITSYLDTNTRAFVNYVYALQAEDVSGLRSELSDVYNLQQLDKRKVETVKNLTAIVSKENRMVKLSWEFAGNATGFKIYRQKNDGPLETYQFVNGRDREFYDKRLNPNSEYTYLMIAEMRGGYTSGYSNKIKVDY